MSENPYESPVLAEVVQRRVRVSWSRVVKAVIVIAAIQCVFGLVAYAVIASFSD